MKFKKGDQLMCIRDSRVRNGQAPTIKKGNIVIVEGVGTMGSLWFKHSHELGGNFDKEDFTLAFPIYEIY